MWLNVALETDAAHVETLTEALLARGALSVGVEDAEAGTANETPQFGEPGSGDVLLWQRSRIVALFEMAEDIVARVASAAREAGLDDLPEIELTEVAEQNWVQLTQSQFEPIRITDRLWIVPSWHQAPNPRAINLVLDPGMAFGTGSHPTTSLCLEWLNDSIRGGESVLDYGCGSGILGIAALKLGAGRTVGADIDEQALQAAAANAAVNGVPLEVISSRQSLTDTFDIVVANILTNPLCLLAPTLVSRTAAGGSLVLSGILETQAEQVIAAYAPFLPLHVGATREGWVRLQS
jgi:ribosomal protein L11 methyltransferase